MIRISILLISRHTVIISFKLAIFIFISGWLFYRRCLYTDYAVVSCRRSVIAASSSSTGPAASPACSSLLQPLTYSSCSPSHSCIVSTLVYTVFCLTAAPALIGNTDQAAARRSARSASLTPTTDAFAPTKRKRKVGGKRYEARSRGRSSPDTLAVGACETPRR